MNPTFVNSPYFRGGGRAVNVTAPVITGGTAIGSVLTASTGTWDYAVSYTYTWRRNGDAIDGATNTTLDTTGLAAGDITCLVRGVSPTGLTRNSLSNTISIA